MNIFAKIPRLRAISFKNKLFVYSLLISLLPVVLVGTVSAHMAAAMIQDEVNHNHQIILQQVQREVDSFWESLDNASIQLANHMIIERAVQVGPSSKSFDLMLEMVDAIQKQRSISDLQYDVSIIFLQYGKVYNSKLGFIDLSEFPLLDIIDRLPPYFRSTMISPDTYPGQHELIYSRPIPIFSNSREDGLLMLHVSKDKLVDFAGHAPLGGDRKLYVLDENGTVLISSNPSEIGKALIPAAAAPPQWQHNGSTDAVWNGVRYRITSRQSDSNRWTYVTMTPKKELDRQAEQIQMLTWGITILLAVLWILVARFGTSRLYGPIQKLLQRLADLAKPGSSSSAQDDEWGTLNSFFSSMIHSNESMRRQLNEQSPYMQETVVLQLLRGELSDRETETKKERLGLDLKGDRFCVCLVDVDEYMRFRQLYKEKDRSLMMYSLRKMAEEVFEDSFSCLSGISISGQVALIVGLGHSGDAYQRLIGKAGQFHEMTIKYYQFSVTVACSRPVKTYRDISDAYQEARDLIGYRLLLGHNQVLTPERVEPSVKESGHDFARRQNKIISAVLQGSTDTAAAELREWVHDVPHAVRHSEGVLGLFAHLIGALSVQLQERGLDMEEVIGEDHYKRLYAMTSLQEMTEWLTGTVFETISAALDQLQTGKQERLVGVVIRYIHEHYDTDLSLQTMADQLNVSAPHLSRMFKDETGMNFIDYLIGYRMEKAKEWLALTDMPIKDIAERLSYTSVQNFTRIFKQTVQLPPGEFRKQSRNE